MNSLKDSLGDMNVDEVIALVSLINEQMVAMPKALKNLLDKFSDLHPEGYEVPCFKGNIIEDDILLSSDVIALLNDTNYNEYISDSYQEEIQGLSEFNIDKVDPDKKEKIEQELESEFVENAFNQVVLEIISGENCNDMPAEEHEFFINILKEEMELFVETGQYAQILRTLQAFKSNYAKNRFPDLISEALEKFNSSRFISSFLHSLRFCAREKRAEVIQLVEFYGEKIIAPMIDALANEESLAIRKLLISCITIFEDKAAEEAVKRLNDTKWYVQRNMLFILKKCGTREMIQLARPYCDNNNPKVSFEAIYCLLEIQDDYPVKTLRKYLRSRRRDLIMKTVATVGAFKVKDAVPDLIQLLERKNLVGIDFTDKIAIIGALGQIGDSRALGTLDRILSSKNLLYKSHLEKLKKEIFISLKKYDHNAAKEIMAKHKKQEDNC
jgi:hypothetical protein